METEIEQEVCDVKWNRTGFGVRGSEQGSGSGVRNRDRGLGFGTGIEDGEHETNKYWKHETRGGMGSGMGI